MAGGTLEGTKRVNYWQNPKNMNVYVLIKMSKKKFKSYVDTAIHSSYNNQNDQWQQSQSREAVRGLNAKVVN